MLRILKYNKTKLFRCRLYYSPPGKRKIESVFQENTKLISLQGTLHRTATTFLMQLTITQPEMQADGCKTVGKKSESAVWWLGH